MISTHGTYKDLDYDIVQQSTGTSYSIYDFGKVTNEKIEIQFGSTSDDRFTEEYVKSEIDRIIKQNEKEII